jgi:hypothetical protein
LIWKVQTMELFIMQFSAPIWYLISLRYKIIFSCVACSQISPACVLPFVW